ncbi:MAG: hypothetical protein K2N91_06140 [Muribaculaceae bacterium]|nr:hypothetical protein [Muribaculaceae bacterium]
MCTRNKTLSQNLTFEEFEALANRRPNLKGDWLYKVTQAMYDNRLKYPYPKFELDYHKECYFKTFQAAEKFVKDNRENVYCSWITQIAYGHTTGYGGTGAEWLYDNNGVLLDYTITNGFLGNVENDTFFGRPKSRQRFKEGDIVEVITARSVHLAVLNLQIPDVEWCWKRYKERDEFGFYYRMDFSDDSAVVIDGPNYYCHDHIGALQLLKPRFPIPKEILSDMRTWNERCKNEDDSEWLKYMEPHRTERQKEKGEDFGQFYEMNLYLHWDKNNRNPHLHINDLYGLKVGLHIDRPEYYDHANYIGRLTANQIKNLYSYLTHTELGKTRWWYMLRKWNENNDNPSQAISLDTPMPNYLELINANMANG